MTDWTTVEEFAEKEGMSVRTVRRLCVAGKIPGARKERLPGRQGWTWMIPVGRSAKDKDNPGMLATPGCRSQGDRKPGHAAPARHARQSGLWEAATADERAIAEHRQTVLEAWIARGRARQDGDPGRATLYQWDRRFRAQGVTGLLPRFRGAGESTVPPWAAQRFKEVYLDTRRPTIRACYDLLVHEARTRGETIPGYSAFQRLAMQIPKNALILGRAGHQAYQQQCDPPILRDYTAYAVNEEWHCDHAQCDYFVLDPRGSSASPRAAKRVRPWKTEWMDLRSRRVVGSVVYAGTPTSETVLASFRAAALRFGLPERAVMDNGLEMAAYCFSGGSRWRGQRLALEEARLRSTLGLLGVAVRFTEPENPRSRGALERKFRTNQDRFDRTLPTYCGNRPHARPEDLATRLDQAPTLAEAQALYQKYLDAEYHERPHSGHGMDGRSPRAVYETLKTHTVTATEDELIFCCYKTTKPATVTKKGVRFFDRSYQWDGYGLLLGKKVYARYDPDALGTVWLFDERDVAIGPATCRLLLEKDAGESDWRRLRAMKKRERELARAAAGLTAQRRREPDPWRQVLEAKTVPPAGKSPTVITPRRTPLRGVAKQAAAERAKVAASQRRSVAETKAQEPEWKVRARERAEKADAFEALRKEMRDGEAAMQAERDALHRQIVAEHQQQNREAAE